MADAVFIDGVPAKITVHDFRRHHLAVFPALTDSDYDNLISEAIDTVYAMFYGVSKMWDLLPRQVWYDKTVRCYLLLTAWFITDQYPALATNYAGLNGVLLKRKHVDGVDLTFETPQDKGTGGEAQDLRSTLCTNDFGRKAFFMIRTCAKRALLRNVRFI